MNIVVGVTGAISCLNMPAYLLALRSYRPDDSVTVVLSESATHMISPSVLSLFAQVVLSPSDREEWSRVNHVQVAANADAVVIAPATAARLSRLARGDGDDLIGLVALAHPRPLLIFPSMNRSMWRNAAVIRNCETLASDGHVVVQHEAPCFEVLTGVSEVSPAMPPPKEWVASLVAHASRFTDEESPLAEVS